MVHPDQEVEISLNQRMDDWFKEADRYIAMEAAPPESVLTDGYRLFFDHLEPFKYLSWIRAKDSGDTGHSITSYSVWRDRIEDFQNLFGESRNRWEISVYNFSEPYLTETQSTIKVSCGEQDFISHGDKIITVYLKQRDNRFKGQMQLGDNSRGWVRSDDCGRISGRGDKSLFDYSGLEVCKLAVGLVEIYTQGLAKTFKFI